MSKRKYPIFLQIEGGKKSIKSEFVDKCRHKEVYSLKKELYHELDGLYECPKERTTKRKKIIDRCNILLNRIGKEKNYSNFEEFITSSSMKQLMSDLKKANLTYSFVQDGKPLVPAHQVFSEAWVKND